MIEDSLRKVRSVYYKSPQFVKLILGNTYRSIPMSKRLGKEYIHFCELISQSNNWSAQQYQDYTYLQLKDTLTAAFNHIPFYKSLYASHGLTLSDFKAPEDLQQFPTITKQDVKDNYSQFISSEISSASHLVTTTGGSTSEPMRFLQIKGVTRPKERAFICAGWGRVGYRYGDKAVQLKGRPVGEPDKGVFWEYEPIQNYLEMDSNYLTEKNIPAYLKQIKKFNAEYMIGFPSSIYLLAKYLKDSGDAVPRFKAIMLASENVYPWQRALLEDIFDCRIYSHYGHSEMVLLAMESEVSNDLLVFPQYGYLEVIDGDGSVLTGEGEKGELIGTSFHNPLMPFIRYRTQDVGTIGAPDSNLPHYPVLSDVEGRLQEFIVTGTQRLISICTMGAAHFDVLDNVAETQYYQEEAGTVEFHVVPKAGYNELDEKRIYKSVKDKLGADVTLKVKCVDAIKRTKSGKHMMLVQKIKDVPLYHGEKVEELS